MKYCTLILMFAVIIGNIGGNMNGYRIKRNIHSYCRHHENLRALGWFCIEKYLSVDQKEMYQTVTSCFDKTSFDQVLNLFCGLSNQERIALVLEHIHCFQNVDMESFAGGSIVVEEKLENCVAERFKMRYKDYN